MIAFVWVAHLNVLGVSVTYEKKSSHFLYSRFTPSFT